MVHHLYFKATHMNMIYHKYSAPGKGFNFVEEAFNQMTNGYGAIIIQDSAGNGQGTPYTERILKNNTLEASIKMPAGLFGNKASVSVCIFIFKVGRPHEVDDLVTFIDMSEDGYSRLNRKKSTQETNLRDTDDAVGHYKEAVTLSCHLMNGHKGDLFVLTLSFILWQLLTVVTFGLASVFVAPYVLTAQAVFANKIIEKSNQQMATQLHK